MAPSLAENMVYSLRSALLGKISVYFNAPPPAGELQACWSPNTTSVITAIPDVILKPVQSDLVGYRGFFWPNFRIIDLHLVLVWADLHLFSTILTALFELNNFSSDM